MFGDSGFLEELQKIFAAHQDQIDASVGQYGYDLADPMDQLRAAEEYMARLAERGENLTLFERVLVVIQAAIRQMGFDLKLTQTDLRKMLVRSTQRLQGNNTIRIPIQVAPAYSRTAVPVEQGITVQDIKESIAHMVLKWPHQPDIREVQSITDLPQDLQKSIKEAGNHGWVGGVTDPETATIYLVADHLKSRLHARQTLVHEIVGHAAFEEILGDDLESTLRKVMRLKTISPKIKAVANDVEGRNGFLNEADEAKEIVAVMAERGIDHPLLKQIVSKFRQWIRETLGIAVPFNQTDLEALIVRASRHLEQGGKITPKKGNPKLSVSSGSRYNQAMKTQNKNIPQGFSARSLWPNDFPDVVIQADESVVKQHPDYSKAKAGDPEAAYRLVKAFFDLRKTATIHAMVSNQTTLVVGVQAQETTGNNAIPRAYAKVLAYHLGLNSDRDIVQANVVSHTGARGFHRLAVQPVFDGKVFDGRDYVIVDDFIGMGGTVANIRGHIERDGGHVVGVTVLTGKEQSARIRLESGTLQSLRKKHGNDLESWWREKFGGGFDRLTESEAGYLLRQQNADTIRNRIAKAERRLDRQAGRKSDGIRSGRGEVLTPSQQTESQEIAPDGGFFDETRASLRPSMSARATTSNPQLDKALAKIKQRPNRALVQSDIFLTR